MSMQGIGPAGLPQWLRGPGTAKPAGGADEAAESQKQSQATQARPDTASISAPAPAAPEASGAVPDGVDAELWSLLTNEERAHFARFAAMGGVTYGPRAASSSRPPVQGQRLDLRI